jgi:hypothetical protein
MSRLPAELEILGDELEAATARALRRRARRQAFINGAGAILLAVPLAVAVSAADVAPDTRPSGLPGLAPTVVPTVPVSEATVRRVHHEAVAPSHPGPCVDICRTPDPPPPTFVPSGRI